MSIQEFERTQQRKEAVHFKTGSRADGLVPVDINPTMSPDYDAMWILPSIFDVNIGHKKGFYLQCERDVPTHVTVRAVPQIPDHGCLTTVRANRYLNAESLLKSAGTLSEILFSNDAKKHIHGPVCCVEYDGKSYDLLCAVACRTPFEDIRWFAERRKSESWMKHIPHERICKQRGILVPKPYINCDDYKKKILFR